MMSVAMRRDTRLPVVGLVETTLAWVFEFRVVIVTIVPTVYRWDVPNMVEAGNLATAGRGVFLNRSLELR